MAALYLIRGLNAAGAGCVRGPLAHLQAQERSMSQVLIEIRAAEGGTDAKLLVVEQRNIYLALAARAGVLGRL
jgi:hypothetical protein